MTFKCEICDAQLDHEKDKMRHDEIFHPKNDGSLKCDKCSKRFANSKIFDLHVQLHDLNCLSTRREPDVVKERDLLYQEVKKQLEDVPNSKTQPSPTKPRRIYRPPSKRVGLTKIRMEDCLRCDACSCIYIDERDYYKHMRNFHEKYNTIIPRTRKKSPTNFRFYNPLPTNEEQSAISNFIKQENQMETNTSGNIKENIKNRWTKVLSQRLISPPLIKKEPEEPVEFSSLFCEVELKIKTEPTDPELTDV